MFQVGDVVVCINHDYTKRLEFNKIYTISHVFDTINLVSIGQAHISFSPSQFMLLTEYRKLKINKIKERISGI